MAEGGVAQNRVAEILSCSWDPELKFWSMFEERSICWCWECNFSWQAQHLVKFWEIAGEWNTMLFHSICVSKVSFLTFTNGRVAACLFHARIMAWSCPNRLSIGGSIWQIFGSNLDWTCIFGGSLAEFLRLHILDLYCWCVLRGERHEFLTFFWLCFYSRMDFW